MEVVSIRTPGLGDTSYVLIHAGYGLVVDPQRDVDRFLAVLRESKVQATHVLETHVHNDYVSGGRELARRLDADLVIPAAAGVAFPHLPAFHGERLTGEGGLSIAPLHTPGHTPEHTSYLVLEDERPVAVFSGGSLLVQAAGRTDLLGEGRARQLALAQFGSVSRLAGLPGHVELLPTHGQGSFCTSSSAGPAISTIGRELRESPVLRFGSAEEFAEAQLAGLQPYPSYYAHMGPINLMGPPAMPPLDVRELTRPQLEALSGRAQVVDARARRSFAAGHLPGSLGIEAGDGFASWVGWLTPFGSPLVFVVEDEDPRALAEDVARIGFDHVAGFVRDLTPWTEGELSSYRVATLEEFGAAALDPDEHSILDVRAPGEWERAHIPGSINRYVPDLLHHEGDLGPGAEVWVVCESGFRSTIAASLLKRYGAEPVVLDRGGVTDVLGLPTFRRAALSSDLS